MYPDFLSIITTAPIPVKQEIVCVRNQQLKTFYRNTTQVRIEFTQEKCIFICSTSHWEENV